MQKIKNIFHAIRLCGGKGEDFNVFVRRSAQKKSAVIPLKD